MHPCHPTGEIPVTQAVRQSTSLGTANMQGEQASSHLAANCAQSYNPPSRSTSSSPGRCALRATMIMAHRHIWDELPLLKRHTGVSLMMLMASWLEMTSHSPSDAMIITSSSEVRSSSRMSGVDTCHHPSRLSAQSPPERKCKSAFHTGVCRVVTAAGVSVAIQGSSCAMQVDAEHFSTVGASHGQAGRASGTCAHHIALQQAVPEGTGDGEDAAHTPGAGPHHHPAGSLNAISLVRSVGLVVVRQLHGCMFAPPHQQALSTLCSLERAIHAAQQHACMMKTGYTGLLVHMEAYQCTHEM